MNQIFSCGECDNFFSCLIAHSNLGLYFSDCSPACSKFSYESKKERDSKDE